MGVAIIAIISLRAENDYCTDFFVAGNLEDKSLSRWFSSERMKKEELKRRTNTTIGFLWAYTAMNLWVWVQASPSRRDFSAFNLLLLEIITNPLSTCCECFQLSSRGGRRHNLKGSKRMCAPLLFGLPFMLNLISFIRTNLTWRVQYSLNKCCHHATFDTALCIIGGLDASLVRFSFIQAWDIRGSRLCLRKILYSSSTLQLLLLLLLLLGTVLLLPATNMFYTTYFIGLREPSPSFFVSNETSFRQTDGRGGRREVLLS